MNQPVVIDANRIFSMLLASNAGARLLLASASEYDFYSPKFVVVELFKHKETISRLSRLDEPDLLGMLHTLLHRIHFYDEDAISIGSWTEAWRLCRSVDAKDVAYLALALELDADLWTGDRELETGLRKKGYERFFRIRQ